MTSRFIDFLDECLGRRPSTPESTACSAALLAWSSEGGVGTFDAIVDDPAGAGRTAFRKSCGIQGARMRGVGGIRLASWIVPEILANQLLPLARPVAGDRRFSHIVVLSGVWDRLGLASLGWFLETDFVHSPDLDWNNDLDFVQIMVGGEASLDRSGFPKGVKRFLQPHGIDAPIRHSVLHFGAGTIYDHILCPSFDPLLQRELDPPLFRKIIPPPIQEHGTRGIVAIPAGYPKLDTFLKAARSYSGTPSRIVYHFSNWGLESRFARDGAASIIRELLGGFPDRTVVFRPMPKDLETPEIRGIIASFQGEPRFVVSTAGSYIEDYLDAALLVHHRSSSADVFAMATGRPVLMVAPPGSDDAVNPHGTIALGIGQVVPEARRLLMGGQPSATPKSAIPLANPGDSVEYVLDCFETVMRGGNRPEWMFIPLQSSESPDSSAMELLHSGFAALGAGVPFRTMAREMVKRHPRSWVFNFLAAVGLKLDGHPTHYAEYASTWLESLECISNCFVEPRDIDDATDIAVRFRSWIATDFVELLLVMEWWIRNGASDPEVDRFLRAMGRIRFFPGADSVHGIVSSTAPRTGEADALRREVAELSVVAGVDAFEKGEVAQSEGFFRRASELLPGQEAPLIGLAHCAIARKDRQEFLRCAALLSKVGSCSVRDLERRAAEAFGG